MIRKLPRTSWLDLHRLLEIMVAYLNNPSEEPKFGNHRIKKQHETMKLQKMKKFCLAKCLIKTFNELQTTQQSTLT